MSKLATAISKAVVSTLTADLPTAVADKFNVDAAEFKEFLTEYLKSHLEGTKSKGAKKPSGRLTGYNLYSKEARSKDKSLDFKAIGAMWRELSESQKAEWNGKAKSGVSDKGSSSEAGEESPKTSKKAVEPPSDEEQEAAPKKSKSAAGKKAVEPPSDEEQEAAPKKSKSAAGKKAAMKVAFDRSTKKWLVEGTQYYIEGSKNRVIVGKLIDKKEMPLTQSDIRACEDKGWKVSSVENDDGTISE